MRYRVVVVAWTMSPAHSVENTTRAGVVVGVVRSVIFSKKSAIVKCTATFVLTITMTFIMDIQSVATAQGQGPSVPNRWAGSPGRSDEV